MLRQMGSKKLYVTKAVSEEDLPRVLKMLDDFYDFDYGFELAYGQEKSLKAEQRAKLAIAMGAASVMCTGTQPPEPEVIEKLYHQVILEEV